MDSLRLIAADKESNDDVHRALHDNTEGFNLGPFGSINLARHAIPCVSPLSNSSDYYAPTMMKVSIDDSGTSKSFFIPVCYEEGAYSESYGGSEYLNNIEGGNSSRGTSAQITEANSLQLYNAKRNSEF